MSATQFKFDFIPLFDHWFSKMRGYVYDNPSFPPEKHALIPAYL